MQSSKGFLSRQEKDLISDMCEWYSWDRRWLIENDLFVMPETRAAVVAAMAAQQAETDAKVAEAKGAAAKTAESKAAEIKAAEAKAVESKASAKDDADEDNVYDFDNDEPMDGFVAPATPVKLEASLAAVDKGIGVGSERVPFSQVHDGNDDATPAPAPRPEPSSSSAPAAADGDEGEPYAPEPPPPAASGAEEEEDKRSERPGVGRRGRGRAAARLAELEEEQEANLRLLRWVEEGGDEYFGALAKLETLEAEVAAARAAAAAEAAEAARAAEERRTAEAEARAATVAAVLKAAPAAVVLVTDDEWEAATGRMVQVPGRLLNGAPVWVGEEPAPGLKGLFIYLYRNSRGIWSITSGVAMANPAGEGDKGASDGKEGDGERAGWPQTLVAAWVTRVKGRLITVRGKGVIVGASDVAGGPLALPTMETSWMACNTEFRWYPSSVLCYADDAPADAPASDAASPTAGGEGGADCAGHEARPQPVLRRGPSADAPPLDPSVFACSASTEATTAAEAAEAAATAAVTGEAAAAGSSGEVAMVLPPKAPALARQASAPASLALGQQAVPSSGAALLRKYDPTRDGPLPARPLIARSAPKLTGAKPQPRPSAAREAEDAITDAADNLPPPDATPVMARMASLPMTAGEKAAAAKQVADIDVHDPWSERVSALFLATVLRGR